MQNTSKVLTITSLRSNIYNVFDELLESGEPVLVQRGDDLISISPITNKKKGKLANLVQHDVIVGDPEELINFPTAEWNEIENL